MAGLAVRQRRFGRLACLVPDPHARPDVLQALVEGKVVALPTETVYIATASALCESAVERLLALRGGRIVTEPEPGRRP